MRKSSTDIFCGLSFLVIGAGFWVQLAELEGVSRVFPCWLLSLWAGSGLWGKGFGNAAGNPPRGRSVNLWPGPRWGSSRRSVWYMRR